MNPDLISVAILGLAVGTNVRRPLIGKDVRRPPIGKLTLRPVRGTGEYGVVYDGEAGGFMFVRLDAADKQAKLVKVTFDFSSCGLRVAGTPMMVPVTNHGVATFQSFSAGAGSPVFGFTATGFEPGDDLLLQAPKMVRADNMPALTEDLFGGKLTVEVSDGRKIEGVFSVAGRNASAAIAAY
jgi:hypothetical protein